MRSEYISGLVCLGTIYFNLIFFPDEPFGVFGFLVRAFYRGLCAVAVNFSEASYSSEERTQLNTTEQIWL